MRITDALLGEHGVFYAQFDHLEEMLVVPDSLRQIQDATAMLAAALEPHARMEDELLFDSIREWNGRDIGALAVMRDEHRQVEHMLHAIRGATDITVAAMLLREAIQLAREHFAKEEQVAFPLAEEILGEAAVNALGAEWAERRAVRIG